MSETFTCTKDNPWDKAKSDRAVHPSAVSTGECADSCCDLWHCPICDLHFRTEVGQ